MQKALIQPSLLHLPLEPYKQRYTEFLAEWEKEAFNKRFSIETVLPQQDGNLLLDIKSGSVLDSTVRPVWAMQQISSLISRPGALPLGHIYASDFYTPGLDALAYCGRSFKISAYCWAQTFDRYDFSTKMMPWMRPWEIMAFNIYDHVFVASELLKDLIVTALPEVANQVHVVGLPFNSEHVVKQMDKTFDPGVEIDCVYTSRWDKEKQPGFFLDLVTSCPDLHFAVCSGWSTIRGNDQVAIQRLERMLDAGQPNLHVFPDLTKGKYYAILALSKVQLNCALQDWVSFTLLEALTFGCLPLYPNFRSFPEALNYSWDALYRPFDLGDAKDQLLGLVEQPRGFYHAKQILEYHDHALDNIADIMLQ